MVELFLTTHRRNQKFSWLETSWYLSRCFNVIGERYFIKGFLLWLLWVDSGRQLSPTQLLPHSFPQGMGKRIKSVRNLMGRNKDGLIGKAKTAYAGKAKWGINSVIPISTQVFIPFPGEQSFIMISRSWKTNTVTPNIPSSSLFVQFLLLSIMYYDMGYPFFQSGSVCPLPISCEHPAIWLVEQREKQKRPWNCVNTGQQNPKYNTIYLVLFMSWLWQ